VADEALDVNVWLAAVWGRHVHHRRAKQDDVDRGLTDRKAVSL
jgi:predicted nucleic acid-binding protein